MNAQLPHPVSPATGWRLKLGAVMFALSILLPAIAIPLVASMDLTGTVAATVSGALLAAAELIGLGAVAVMGKSGYLFIKTRVLAFLKRHGPPRKVSRARYRLGLAMFALPLLFGWVAFYVLGPILDLGLSPISIALGGDVLLLASLFVLGGEFWDKLRSLFVYDAKVVFPGEPGNGRANETGARRT